MRLSPIYFLLRHRIVALFRAKLRKLFVTVAMRKISRRLQFWEIERKIFIFFRLQTKYYAIAHTFVPVNIIHHVVICLLK